MKEGITFNLAVHSEHAESVTLLLLCKRFGESNSDVRFDFLRNNSGRDLALPDSNHSYR